MSNVSVIGLDMTGSALVTALVERGCHVCACARPLENPPNLVAGDATFTTRVEDAVAASELLIICTEDYFTARTLLERAGEVIRSRMLVTLTQGSAVEAQAMARWAEARSLSYLDGRIIAVPGASGRTETLMLYSGSRTFFRCARRELEALGESRFVGDDPIMAALVAPALAIVACGVFAPRAGAAGPSTGNDIEDYDALLAQALPYLGASAEFVPHFIHQAIYGVVPIRPPCNPTGIGGYRHADYLAACPNVVRQTTSCCYRRRITDDR